MIIAAVLDQATWIVVGSTMAAVVASLLHLLVRLAGRPPRGTGMLVDAPPARPLTQCLRLVFVAPALHFHRRASRVWTVGYCLYHAAVVLVVSGYALSITLLAVRWWSGAQVPDILTGFPSARSTSPSNLVALVFGNAEPIASRFLFGRVAAAFQALCLVELPCAVAGNLCMLYAVLGRRWGAVNHDLDDASRGLRLPGRRSAQRLFVRCSILSIIVMEVIGRHGWVHGIAFWHAAVGLVLIAILPFTYLRHIPWSIAAVLLAVARRRRNATA